MYIRGDFNVNEKNLKRKDIFNYFKEYHELNEVHINHPTYHHFMGNGDSDSHLDRIICSVKPNKMEKLVEILCKHHNPWISSLHDAILSSWIPSPIVITDTCKESMIAPLFKSGDRELPVNYRPVALTSHVAKILREK